MRATWARARARVDAHPLVVALLVALPSAVLSGWDIWHRRVLGTYDPDEAGYLANSLRLQRAIDFAHPGAFLHELWRTYTGPLVPAASLVTLIIGPSDPRSAMMVQPLLMIVLAVATAGMVLRVTSSGGWAVLTAGFMVAVPSVVWSAESYWFALGAAAALACALWALLASDGLQNRWRWAFGAGVGAMVLARTMTIAFLPAIALAALILVWGDRRRLRGLAEAVLVGLVVAGPWYVIRRKEVFGYLFTYGYSGRAARFGDGSALERVVGRVAMVNVHAFHVLLVVALLAFVLLLRGPRVAPSRWSRARREAAALGALVLVGTVALASSSNNGVWFDLPLLAPLVVLGVVAARRAPAPLPTVMAVGMVASALVFPVATRYAYLGRVDFGASEYDARFTRAQSPAARRAATDWARLNRDLAARLAELTHRGDSAEVVMTGNTFVVNTNTVGLAAELDRWSLTPLVPETPHGPAGWAEELRPRSRIWRGDGPIGRFIVVLHHDYLPFAPDERWRDFERAVADAGWRPVARLPFPGDRGGEAVIYRPPPSR